MLYQPHFLYRFRLTLLYALGKLTFIHGLLPKSLKDKLPVGWNHQMFWVAFKSGGKRVYFDYYCTMREPISYQPKATVAPEHQLTEEDIRSFYKKGYLEPFRAFSQEEIEDVRRHVIDLVSNADSDTPDYNSELAGLARSAFKTKNMHLRDSTFRDLFKNPAITERCAQLLGPDLVMWRSHCFHIPAFSTGNAWHQTSTWMTNMKESILQPPDIHELFNLTCWIALQDTPKEKACLKILPGKYKELYPLKSRKLSDSRGAGNNKYTLDVDYQIDENGVDLLEVKAGQCIVFVDRVLHASADNKTDEDRWAAVGRIIRPDTRAYTKKMLKEGYWSEVNPNVNDDLDDYRVVLLRGEDRYEFNKKI